MSRAHQRLLKRAYKNWLKGEFDNWGTQSYVSPYICDNLQECCKAGEDKALEDLLL